MIFDFSLSAAIRRKIFVQTRRFSPNIHRNVLVFRTVSFVVQQKIAREFDDNVRRDSTVEPARFSSTTVKRLNFHENRANRFQLDRTPVGIKRTDDKYNCCLKQRFFFSSQNSYLTRKNQMKPETRKKHRDGCRGILRINEMCSSWQEKNVTARTRPSSSSFSRRLRR